MKTRSTLLMMSLVLATPAGAWAAAASKQSTSRQQTADLNQPAVRSTSDDPIGAWLEKNGDRFGLYMDQDVKPRSQPKSGAKLSTKTPPPGFVKTSGGPQSLTEMQKAVGGSGAPRVDQEAFENLIRQKTAGGSNAPVKTQVVQTEQGAMIRAAPVPPAAMSAAAPPAVEKKVFTPPAAAVQTADAAAQIAAVMKDLEFSDRCDQFATESGFGSWGRVIIEELVRGEGDSLLRGTDDLRRACPNYDYLGVREKSYVWVKIIASMTFLESSCNPRAGLESVVNGPNGRAAGLLQLHKNKEHTYGANCSKGASLSPTATLKCAISMLDRQVEKTQALFSRATYWGVLRPQGDVVSTKRGKRRVVLAKTVIGGLRELPICQRR